MEKLALKKEVQSLGELRELYESQLRSFGLDICDLIDLTPLLDICGDLQRITNLQDLEQHYLEEYYFTKKRESLQHQTIINQYHEEKRELEAQIAEEEKECILLEKFITQVNERIISEAEVQRNKTMMEAKMKNLQERQEALITPEDLNIEELIKKVELLKCNKLKDRK